MEPNSEIRLLVLDIDGTIAGESNMIREPVKQAVKAAQAQGVQVAIATGRMYQSALRFHQDLGADLPLMTYQGALIKNPQTGEILRHWRVPRQQAVELLDFYEQPEWREALSVHFYIDDQLYVRSYSSDTKGYASRSGIQAIPVGDLRQTEQEPTKVLALGRDPDLMNRLYLALRDRYGWDELYLTKSVPTFVEATHPQVNKGTAVRYLAEECLGLQAAQVMAIGDNFNDLEMLDYAGIGVAMGDAPEPVQAAATWVTPSVEEDGAAIAIEKFLLNR